MTTFAVRESQAARCSLLMCLAIALLLSCNVAMGAPKLSAIMPSGAQRGTSVDVTCQGEFEWPVQARAIGATVEVLDEKGKLRVTLPDDLATDRIWIRLYDATGSAAPRPFLVGSLPEVLEVEPNNHAQEAQLLDLTSATVNGALSKHGDVDSFRVELARGQTLVAAVAAHTPLGSPMDAMLQVAHEDGHVVAENHDSVGLDPRIVYTAPEDGSYLVRVFAFPSAPNSSIRYSGSSDYIYRLTMTSGPFVTHTVPMTVSQEDPGSVELRGWNIAPRTKVRLQQLWGQRNDADAESIEVEDFLDQRRPNDSTIAFAFDPLVAGSVRVRQVPHETTRIPLSTGGPATKLELPNSIAGCLESPNQADRFQFSLRKDRSIVVAVESHSRHSPLVPLVKLVDESGKVVSEINERGSAKDAVIKFQPKTDGTYTLTVMDRYRAGGPDYFYQLTVRELESDVFLSVSSESVVVKPDESLKLKVKVDRKPVGHDTEKLGAMRVVAKGLPPSIVCQPVVSDAEGDSSKEVVLSLQSDGTAFSGPVQIIAESDHPECRRRVAMTPAVFGIRRQSIWLTALARAEPETPEEATDVAADNDEVEAENTPTQHSFLAVGKAAGVQIVGEDGQTKWQLELPCSDGWVLPNGNLLLAVYPTKGYPKGGVVEIDRDTKNTVFSYQGQQAEISTALARPDGTMLVAELGEQPRAIVINRRGEILKSTPLQCQRENAHMQTRMLRVLPNGNYLAPHLLDFAVKEYEPATGKVVQTIPTDDRGREKRDWPFTAIRLENGNTLIACTNGNRIIEVNTEGAIVWSVSNDDLPRPLFDDACGAQRLPNGNTVISSYHAAGDRVKLFEVTREKQVVWTYDGGSHGFHHFQILTTNGTVVTPSLK